jgi:hypothetical protein
MVSKHANERTNERGINIPSDILAIVDTCDNDTAIIHRMSKTSIVYIVRDNCLVTPFYRKNKSQFTASALNVQNIIYT